MLAYLSRLLYFCGLIRTDISDRKNRHNEEVTVDDCSRDDGYCGSEGPGESGRTRVLLRKHHDEGDGRSEERRERD